MAKLETFEGRTTNWGGLWYHPEYGGFSSQAINLSQLKKFKGVVRLYVRKNKFYKRGDGSNRPNYCFCLKDAISDTPLELEVYGGSSCDDERDCYTDDDGNRLYTYDEVQYAINCAAEDGARGYGYGENMVKDYL